MGDKWIRKEGFDCWFGNQAFVLLAPLVVVLLLAWREKLWGVSGRGLWKVGGKKGENSRAPVLGLLLLGLFVPEAGFVGRPAGVVPGFDEEAAKEGRGAC